jgi:hypothetical protein
MPDYSKSLVYKLEHVDGGSIYVGSTTNFAARRNAHKTNSANPASKEFNAPVYKAIREAGGFEYFTMRIIKAFPCKTKMELLIEETRVSSEIKPTLNSCKAWRSEEEARARSKELKDAATARGRHERAGAISTYNFLRSKKRQGWCASDFVDIPDKPTFTVS